MGKYRTLKPFRRTVNGDHISIPADRIVNIELRSEAEAGLKGGFLTRDLSPLKKEKKRPSHKWTPEQEASIESLAERGGFPLDAAKVKVRDTMNKMKDDPDSNETKFDAAVRSIRRRLGLISDSERIADYAADMCLKEAELQAEIYELAKSAGVSVAEAIRWHKVGIDTGEDASVFAGLAAEMKAPGVPLDEIEEKIRSDWDQGSNGVPEGAVEVNGRVFVPGTTRVQVTDGEFIGYEGTVLSISKRGVFRVNIDGDDAEFRKMDDDRLEIIE